MHLQRYLERLIWWCMLPLIVLGGVVMLLHLHTLNERRQMLLHSVVRAAASSMDHALEVRLNSLSLLGQLLERPHFLNKGQLNLAEAHEAAMAYLDLQGNHIVIGSATGEMLVNTRVPYGQPLPPMPKANSGTMMALIRQTPVVGDPFIGPIAGVPLMALVVPLKVQQDPQLVLVTTLEIAQLRDGLSKAFNLPKGWVLRLQTDSGIEVFRIPAAGHAERSPSNQDQWRASALGRAPWTVSLLAPPISPLDHSSVQALLLLFTLAATATIGYWGARSAATRLTRAVQTLTDAHRPSTPQLEIHEVDRVRDELMRLQRERLAAQEEERKRLGLELHDDLQQKLALIRFDLAAAPPDEHRERALAWVDESIAITRRLVHDLRPPMLKETGLPLALRALGEQQHQVHGQGLDVSVLDEEPWRSLPEEQTLALYRIAQEALNNVRKHAQAESVHITLSGQPGGEAVMEIADDGVGFDTLTLERSAGHGLRGMRERAHTLGGDVEVISVPGEGTALVVRLPWPLAPEPAG